MIHIFVLLILLSYHETTFAVITTNNNNDKYNTFMIPKIDFNNIISSGTKTANYMAKMFQTYGI